jgi:hypothetical protein
MKKWEYRTIVFSEDYPDHDFSDLYKQLGHTPSSWEEELNEQGRQGWELVSVIHPDPDDRKVVAVLKREIGRP